MLELNVRDAFGHFVEGYLNSVAKAEGRKHLVLRYFAASFRVRGNFAGSSAPPSEFGVRTKSGREVIDIIKKTTSKQ